ncbi:MAG: RsmD family RNA methyltransferase [Actinomycetaceae bacterium]|nr:RsmD family RNA methyltransferase [Arcanobacterium sp.]MDD7505354.1 RsmD family RNA methyltransferase [Actinomycetaceae bacterium]MDY6143127.1 RsmD family RNA methyltransferase [Arcanobacterium sp.]
MTRIVAGSAKGHQLKVPPRGTRPTSERVREGLFSRLEHYGYIQGCNVLDLFGGTGAIALEAKSRGAANVVCVENAPSAINTIRTNIRATGLDIRLATQSVESYLSGPPEYAWDLVFLDPPYAFADDALDQLLERLVPYLADDALVVVERDKKSPEPHWPGGLVQDDDRRWGDTRVWSAVVGESRNTLAT